MSHLDFRTMRVLTMPSISHWWDRDNQITHEIILDSRGKSPAEMLTSCS